MPWLAYFGTGLYIVSFGLSVIIRHLSKDQSSSTSIKKYQRPKSWHWVFVILIMFSQFAFGYANIGKQSLVDEPLWFFDRIEKYWDSIAVQNWKGTNINDKPGITVALFSGIGLFFENPADYESRHTAERSQLYAVLRVPLLAVSILLLPVWFYLLCRLFRPETALLSTLFIGLHPLLLGISRMVNPDSLFWIFTPLSILAFLVHLKHREKSALILSGIFFGLSLLTKYVASILFVFLLGVSLMELLFRFSTEKSTLQKEMRALLLNYFSFIFVGLSVFYILFPAVWINPKKLITSTFLSQAFESTWVYYATFSVILIVDTFLFKNLFFTSVIRFFSKNKILLFRTFLFLFSASVFIAMINVFLEMRWIDFESIVASPKSSHNLVGSFAFYLSHFYSLFFGIPPLLLASFFASLLFSVLKKHPNWTDRTVFYLTIFIFLYYIGLTATGVAATVRYQIVLYPLALIVSATGIRMVLKQFFLKTHYIVFILIGFFLFSSFSLWRNYPFYFSYASSLLPNRYVLNLKEMGDGSYQAAEYLNQLENAKNISIWSDKDGVCVIFIGKCNSSLDFKRLILSKKHFDYYVVSKGRENRTTRLIKGKIQYNPTYLIRFDKLYSFEKPEFSILLGNRENNFIKIINASDIDISYEPDPTKPKL
jgi:4-amino-4-deoxy-L-arabinose transferase-like glycosyltransferase